MTAPTSRRGDVAPGLVAAAVLPVLSLALLRVRFSGSFDASFYLGHIVDLAGHAERFGQTYHGNRIAYILVDRWFVATLGPQAGLLVARHVMLALAVGAAYALGARWAGRTSGLLVAGSVAFVPWLPRELLWTFYDGFAATYLLVATALLLVPVGRRTRIAGEIGAGVLLALAMNANLALGVVVLLTGLSWWVVRGGDGRRRLMAATLRLVVSWAAMTAVLGLTIRSIYPDGIAFPDLVALRVGLDVLSTDQYFTPLRQLGWRLGHLATTVGVGLALLAVIITGRDGDGTTRAVVRAAALQVWGLAGVALVLHHVTRDIWFGAPYYTIYHLPGTVLGLAAILAAVRRRSGRAPTPLVVGALLAGAAAWYAALPLPGGIRPVAAVGVAAAAGLAVAAVASGPRAVPAVATLAMLTLLGATASPWHAGGPDGWDSIAQRNAAEEDMIAHSIELVALVGDHVGRDERLQFWHTTEGRDGWLLSRLNMVFYGTGEGRVHAKSGPGMPSLSEAELTGLASDPPVVVLMGTSPGDVTAGLVALQLAGYRPVERLGTTLDGAEVDVTLRIVALAP